MQERTFDGIWWLPDKPENRAGGRLTYSPRDGLLLEVLGELLSDDALAETVEVPVVHGAIRQGSSSSITLFDSFHLRRTNRGEFAQQTYAPRVASIGAYDTSLGDLSFDSCEVALSHLDEWLDREGFTVTFEDDPRSDAITISHRRPSFTEASVPGLKIEFIARRATGPFGARNFHLDEVTAMRLSFTESRSFIELRDLWLLRLQNFFTLTAGSSSRIERLIAGRGDRKVELLFRHPFDSQPVSRFDLLFRYSEVEHRLSELFGRWFELYDRLHVPLNVLFSTLHGKARVVDEQFLAICQAVEAYHRLTTPLDPADMQTHEARLSEIVESCPPSHRTWLEGRLLHSEEPPLKARLQAVIDRVGDELGGLLFPRKRGQVPGRIARWRNDLTHGNAPRVSAAKDAIALHELTVRLAAALKVNLLLDLGFSLDEIRDMYQRCGWERLVRL
jgi:hypothetical protein